MPAAARAEIINPFFVVCFSGVSFFWLLLRACVRALWCFYPSIHPVLGLFENEWNAKWVMEIARAGIHHG